MNPLLEALWYILPAYFANASPVIFKGRTPMDFGKKFRDGRRILGDGKTWRGFFGGLFTGTLIAVVQYYITPNFYGSFTMALKLGFALSLGALLGDLIGSFIKRRIGMPRGYPAVGLDQWGFLITALILAYPIKTLLTGQVLFLLTVTPFIHWFANIFAYKMKWKSVPW
ncbi:CDP-2,3-bis-(O-geranylgeranyl)-sn-glycerol synthase [Thermococcus sp. M39]|uniref:CDP-2,3-bis-(O-geranylgeranyl)-sn-glycerol synthase n=1 Tax=unclassified Thermococcus TaxID=2627626 RepID=UPI00143974B4|nr:MULTISPECIES: CDP-2,3-bis-(O-geranylgeranyl)-sn-glycerol synthase [unclassified Thermococcus]NJE08344.1 CDP-2,3-bis-(O-geranylgeranyl)-sn-glycerol synthase [Thermococcus sp. M39]NJE11835.1 CDP-2,3-bis-(O-geranylgeranyl)-sn-glycerol synthase [Thermococcus sp. LS2]